MLSLNKRKIIIASVLIDLLIVLAIAGYLWHWWHKPIQTDGQSFIVPKGSGMAFVASKLEERGVIDHPWLLRGYTRIAGLDNQIKAGEYDLSNVTNKHELLGKLTDGEVIYQQVTLIDGWTFKQFRQHLESEDKLVSEIKALSNDELMQRLGASGVHPEGQFAPDTYRFQKGESDLDILRQSYQRQQQLLQNAWQKRVVSEQIKTPEQALILASIIEKETGQASERRQIAGVFYNRLRIGMKLQTDPTVIYGMGDKYKGNIKRVHLRTDTPYNTYTRYGLPPTPIAMPGKASIEAAVNPETTKALYFVGKGDGSHYFSKTLKEHNRAVARYQLGK